MEKINIFVNEIKSTPSWCDQPLLLFISTCNQSVRLSHLVDTWPSICRPAKWHTTGSRRGRRGTRLHTPAQLLQPGVAGGPGPGARGGTSGPAGDRGPRQAEARLRARIRELRLELSSEPQCPGRPGSVWTLLGAAPPRAAVRGRPGRHAGVGAGEPGLRGEDGWRRAAAGG